MAKEIYGKLRDEDSFVPLEISESEAETNEIHKEYHDVFGNSISFFERRITASELKARKAIALGKLLNLLNN